MGLTGMVLKKQKTKPLSEATKELTVKTLE